MLLSSAFNSSNRRNSVQVIHGDIRYCLLYLYYSLISKDKERLDAVYTELRIKMRTEGLGFVISRPTTCIRRNMCPKRGRKDFSFYILVEHK